MPSARIELTSKASEAHVLSIAPRGQATSLLYKVKVNNSTKLFCAKYLTILDQLVYDKGTTENTIIELRMYENQFMLEGGNFSEFNSYSY